VRIYIISIRTYTCVYIYYARVCVRVCVCNNGYSELLTQFGCDVQIGATTTSLSERLGDLHTRSVLGPSACRSKQLTRESVSF